jgi:C-terminal processing protease CtpA/Prc
LAFGCTQTKQDEKEYFVKQCSFVCDYPFDEISKYAVVCRVWGLLKYYHPNVTAGKFDWDNVLLDCLDNIESISSPASVNSAIRNMIQTAGKYKISKQDFHDSLNMNVNLYWIDNSFLDKDIKLTLHEISSITVVQPSYYSSEKEIFYVFKNEKNYELHDLLYGYNYRLLSLFRYWNVIYYFYPYKYLMDKSWDIVLSESVSKFISANDLLSYNKAITDMAVAINDGHAFTSITPHNGETTEYFIMIDSITIVKIPPEQTLLKRGDIILKIGNRNIWNVRDSLAGFISSSNIFYTNKSVDSYLYRIMDGYDVTIQRDRQKLTIPVKYVPPSRSETISVLSFEQISSEIGYVKLDKLKDEQITIMFDSLKHTKGIIFDLRGYPSVLFHNIIRHFTTKISYEYLQFTYHDASHPGAFYYNKQPIIASYTEKEIANINKYTGKIVVLTSETTFSYGETSAIMYRTAGNATLIGRPTAGANGDVAKLLLPHNIYVYFSSLGAYCPDWMEIQRKGVIPDIEVYPDMQSIIEGKDEILEAAISYIKEL